MVSGKEKLIVAIDTDEYEKAVELIDSLENSVEIYKVGLENYISSRGKTVDYLKSKGKKIFLDLKFHDIPNTMKSAVKAAVKDGVWLMTIHVSDMEGMRQCALAAKEEAERLGIERPLIVGVTVLTSLSDSDLSDIGCSLSTEETAIKRAKLAKEAGLDGVVCSAREVSKIVKACGDDFITVCPGIRPKTAEVGDQKRVVTPSDAIKNGATVLVVGRPITKAEKPNKAADEIVKEIESVIK
ncbi:orotidine-5'-phosphate decarboxylase [Peptostreptococcus canis]|uniref:Orotidine 5'-phosphate decarboxylase n=1 Tax=Peptostreptococcus canis TaxID=1159213 RepID=A0ABR6TNB6_9FIRM|nr:orotidine-5'-phosphate decarboxylase [Peptostreptococcus canis]MBC2576713.1 orotidine-5'-phosphate decarboxylase [Peptostreptococcus canis]MBP1998438.1 orotidine-5'-phosphate decarboxylase [Peptostreptococcus canis]